MDNQFNFRYSAPTEDERKEIDSIRRKYAPQEQEETKMEKLRRLDGLVKGVPTVCSLVLGIVGTLVLGLGLTMILEWSIWFWGVALMVIGCIPTALAYPVYTVLFKKYKNRYGEEILRLSAELLNENEK